MPRRRKVPVVGAQQLHPVQIAAPIRHLEAKRTRRAAHREYAPTLKADKQAQQAVRNEYGTEAASYKGASGMLDNSLAQALAGIGNSGLKGSAAKQVKSELTARLGDVASSLPYLLAGNREEEGKALVEGRQQLFQDRAEMQKAAASKLNERLKELRGHGTSVLDEQANHQESTGRSFNDALLTAEKGYQEIMQAVREGRKDKEGNPIKPPSSKTDWLHFAAQVENEADGVDMTTALKAIEAMRRKLTTEAVAHKVGHTASLFGR